VERYLVPETSTRTNRPCLSPSIQSPSLRCGTAVY